MKKAIFQFLIFLCLFFGTWFLLSRIDWVGLLRIKAITTAASDKLGTTIWETISQTEPELLSPVITESLDSMLLPVLAVNNFGRKDKLKIHILRNKEINAFALPGNHLVIYTGLIEDCCNEEEFLGVVCHELAHIQRNHVMKKLVKDVGLSLVMSVSTGSGGGEVAQRLARLLSSTAYDRKMEREADLASVDYLMKAGIDPTPFAGFLYRMSSAEKYIPDQFFRISTHPASKERAVNLIVYIKKQSHKMYTRLDDHLWNRFRASCKL